MTEIKFRAWDKVQNEMTGHSSEILALRKDRFELMQYTGQLDGKGKEIYVGDIVRLRAVDTLKNNQDRIVDVRFDDFTFAFWSGKQRFATVNYNHNPKSKEAFEVIGNIYENPELLK